MIAEAKSTRHNRRMTRRKLLDPIETQKALESVFLPFRFFTGMSCYLVPADEWERWICLQPGPKHWTIKEFDGEAKT
jgi:hypothetical protein